MRLSVRFGALALGLVAFVPALVSAQAYQAAITASNPSHYWKLNETVIGLAANSVAGGVSGTHAGIFGGGFGEVGVPGPGRDQDGIGTDLAGLGVGNLAFGAYNSASIDIGPGVNMGNSTMTVSSWFQVGIGFPGGSDGGDRIWTNNLNDPNTSFQLTLGGGANFVVGLNPANNNFPAVGLPSGPTVGNFQLTDATVDIKNGEWHHVVASRNGNNIENVIVVIDGVNYPISTWSDSTDTWGTTGDRAQIATRDPGDGGGSLRVLNGRTDEVAVWLGRQLSVLESQVIYHASLDYKLADFDNSGIINGGDVDALVADIVAGSNTTTFDLTADGVVNSQDLGLWLSLAGGKNIGAGRAYKIGDANLDGAVDGTDFGLWNSNKFTGNTKWTKGNFNADAVTDGSDFGLWNSNKFTSSDGSLVPEPTSILWLLTGIVVLATRRR